MPETNIRENIISVDLEANTQENQENQRKLDETLSQLQHLTSQHLTSILKKPEQTLTDDDNIVIGCAKVCGVILTFVLLGPLTVASLYYAYTDDSCVHESAGQLEVNLFTYLAVDGILGGAGIIVLSSLICCLGPDSYINMMKSCCGAFLFIVSSLFQLAWTIVGSVIFWKLIDNKKCDKGIYNYVFALLIIKYVVILVNMVYNNNNKKE